LSNALKINYDITALLKQLAAESAPGITWLPGETDNLKRTVFKAMCIKTGNKVEFEYFVEVIVRWSGGLIDLSTPARVTFFDRNFKPAV
jgi:hypothetical protein